MYVCMYVCRALKRSYALSASAVMRNVGYRFLTLVDKHFPKENKLRKIFNRNTIKISYSCMNNE